MGAAGGVCLCKCLYCWVRRNHVSLGVSASQFIVQSLITTLLSTLLLRWSSPAKPHVHLRFLFVLPLLFFVVSVPRLTSLPKDHYYYIAMITWWASLPLALLWWGMQGAWSATSSRQKGTYALAWLLPSAALCVVDRFAMRRGTWHIMVSVEECARHETFHLPGHSPLRRKQRRSTSFPSAICPSKRLCSSS